MENSTANISIIYGLWHNTLLIASIVKARLFIFAYKLVMNKIFVLQRLKPV